MARTPRTLRRASAGRFQDIALEELTVGGHQPKRVVHQDSIPRGADVRPLKDGWWIAKIVIRSFSLVFASCLVILQLHVIVTEGSDVIGTDFLACVIPSLAIILWDASEFITLCCRRGFGITSKAHIGLDLTLCLGALCGLAVACLELSDISYYIGVNYVDESQTSAEIAILAILTIIHFILFVRNIQDRRRGKNVTPRIMYLPTGEPVVVVPRPFPPQPTHQKGKATDSSGRVSSTVDDLSPLDERPLPYIPSPTDATVSEPSRAAGPSTERSPERQPYEARRYSNPAAPPGTVPRRKPVPTRGTPYADPWSAPGPDYVPDAEEQARAARGESQAQWMSLDGMEVIGKGKRPRELTPLTPSFSNESKPSYER